MQVAMPAFLGLPATLSLIPPSACAEGSLGAWQIRSATAQEASPVADCPFQGGTNDSHAPAKIPAHHRRADQESASQPQFLSGGIETSLLKHDWSAVELRTERTHSKKLGNT